MKIQLYRSCRISLLPLMSFFIIACASDPVKFDFPVNHPANPQSQETAFIPPPNPFKGSMQMETGNSNSITPNKQVPAHQHQMEHEMSKEPAPATKSDMEMDGHKHQGHNK